jgi:hypothetical protein
VAIATIPPMRLEVPRRKSNTRAKPEANLDGMSTWFGVIDIRARLDVIGLSILC